MCAGRGCRMCQKERTPATGAVQYEIVVGGRLDEQWSDWLSGMEIRSDGGVTTLTGPVADQPALLGLLLRLGNMNLTLISVKQVEASASASPRPRRANAEQEEA